jgi:hypothetical protein
MFDSINEMVLVGACVLVLVLLASIAFYFSRRSESAYSSDYFGPEYDQDLIAQSDMSDSEAWQADYETRFTPFRLRDPGNDAPRIKISPTAD